MGSGRRGGGSGGRPGEGSSARPVGRGSSPRLAKQERACLIERTPARHSPARRESRRAVGPPRRVVVTAVRQTMEHGESMRDVAGAIGGRSPWSSARSRGRPWRQQGREGSLRHERAAKSARNGVGGLSRRPPPMRAGPRIPRLAQREDGSGTSTPWRSPSSSTRSTAGSVKNGLAPSRGRVLVPRRSWQTGLDGTC